MTFGGAGMYASIVALKPVAVEFEASRSAASLAFACVNLGIGVGGILMGWLSDRFGAMWPSLIGAGCLTLGLVLASFSTELWQYVALHGILIGLLGNSAVLAPLIADITRWFTVNRGMAVAVVSSGNYVAGAVWPPIVQYGIDTVGWRETYQWLGGICLLGMVPLSLLLSRRDSARASPGGSATDNAHAAGQRRQALGFSPRFAQWLICTAGIGCCVAMAMPHGHIVAHASDLGHPAAHGAEMLALMLSFGVLSRLFFGWISDRIGGLRALLIGSVLQAAVIASFIPVTGLDALYWASALFGISQGGIVPAYAIIVRRHFPHHELGWRLGIVMFFTLFGMALGGWAAGVMYDLTGSYRLAFTNALIFNLINVGIVFMLLAKSRFSRLA